MNAHNTQFQADQPTTPSEKLGSGEITKRAKAWLEQHLPSANVKLGLAEWDDRQRAWRISILCESGRSNLGEISFNNKGDLKKHTESKIVAARLKKSQSDGENRPVAPTSNRRGKITFPDIPNKLILGDACEVMEDFPRDAVQLVVTSPPYYNARPEYAEYIDYQEYLDFLRKIFARAHAILAEGRYAIVNVSPVLIRRASRNEASRRIPIPFDLHAIMDKLGFEFIDDIHWKKPEGAGWAAGRGRRFSADRQPLQYKPVVVTEYVLVYRKRTTKLIDWNLKSHPDQEALRSSLILGDYDKTNVWEISPSRSKHHPATYPEELVRRLIRYYSIEGDMVLDPFAGSGTTGRVALGMQRRALMIEKDESYFDHMVSTFSSFADHHRIDIDKESYA